MNLVVGATKMNEITSANILPKALFLPFAMLQETINRQATLVAHSKHNFNRAFSYM